MNSASNDEEAPNYRATIKLKICVIKKGPNHTTAKKLVKPVLACINNTLLRRKAAQAEILIKQCYLMLYIINGILDRKQLSHMHASRNLQLKKLNNMNFYTTEKTLKYTI